MEPSSADDDSDDAEVFSSHHQTPADILLSQTGYSAGQQQYDSHAGPSSSSIPMWSECFPMPSLPVLKPTDGDTAADFVSTVPQGIKSPQRANFRTQVYNFLERPTGWKCFLYHFSV